ncbi:CDP-glycerol glycerophosphotransferase family protein [Algoriphagus hitonicola]|uniref:CDP-Glycerol:Poly(Glycerophosphate) glycerophosphotransferase n=1 Tax=Algoriphagus hitonicola TaxID=435880 RepID=A0A1I2X3Y0_9BACT|nr:CDP-glycerol glycerophosphotransferase family protein [Algoriphagus hitonicola]SFH08234.1 CDP-Glycerol:Poly(glycerophosphate) glycerophosphotransferase [Algoriphagus hitonicola]
MKVCFLIPDGVGVRNYLYSNVLSKLAEGGHEILIWHNLDPEILGISQKIHQKEFKEIFFPTFEENLFIRVIREMSTLIKLKLDAKSFSNPTILDNWDSGKDKIAKSVSILEKFIPDLFLNDRLRQALDRFVLKNTHHTSAFKQYREILEREKPDVVFCTHQRILYAGIALEAAKSLGIKTVTSIFSWDNVPKARLPMRTDYYFVWSHYMKKELMEFYPEIKASSVHVTGTPQFGFYFRREFLKSRENFASKYGLDPDKQWICFSGDDKRTSPYDEEYLGDVASALKDDTGVQILFRQVPVEGTERYDAILSKHSNIHHIAPLWKRGKSWNQYYPTYEDVQLLVNLVFHCKTVVNLGSTMALDFAVMDKPALYLNYAVGPNKEWSPKRTYEFHHFRSMEGFNAVVWIHNKDEIEEKINLCLRNGKEVAGQRQDWLDRVVSHYKDGDASEQIFERIQSLG